MAACDIFRAQLNALYDNAVLSNNPRFMSFSTHQGLNTWAGEPDEAQALIDMLEEADRADSRE